MTPARVRPRVPGFLVCGGLFVCSVASAGPDVALRGSLSLSGVEDDNLFSTPGDGVRDRITRLTPRLAAEYRRPRLSLAGRYTLDAERYADHPDLDTSRARQSGVLDLSARASRRVTASLRGAYLTTLTPGADFNLTTGVASGRAAARRLEISPSVAWRSGPAGGGSVTGTGTQDDFPTGVGGATRGAAVDLDRRLSSRDTGRLRLASTRYEFDTAPTTTAHVVSLGWERGLTRGTALDLRAGPRFSEGRVDAEMSASLRSDLRNVHLSLSGGRSLETVIGHAGPVVTDSVLPAIAFRPRPSFQLSATPGYYRLQDAAGGPVTTVRAVALEAAWSLGERLAIVGSWRRSLQSGILGTPLAPAAGAGDTIAHGTFLVALVARQKEPRQPAGEAPPAWGAP